MRPLPRRASGAPSASFWQWLRSWVCPPILWCWNLCWRLGAGTARLCVRLWHCLFRRRKDENLLLGHSEEARRSQKWEKRGWWLLSWIEIELPIQVRVAGRTGDCEHQFLMKVSHCLSGHLIRLKKDDYSGRFLMVFCPVVSRIGTDMQNALEGLNSEAKVILVVLHHIPKESNRFVDTKLQAHHPAVVRTVHAYYTLEDGLYAGQVNEEAVATVAEILKSHCKEMRGPTRSLALLVVCGTLAVIVVRNLIAMRKAEHIGGEY